MAAMVWASRRGITEPWVRLVCAALKAAGIVLLALALLNPLWVSQRARPGANLFAVIADNSQSLKIRDNGAAQSRGEILRNALAADPKNWQAALEENYQVRRYTFDARLQSARDFQGLDFEGRASSIGGALKSASEQWRGQPVAGVLLFTDGNATDIGADLPPLDGCPPVYPVILGNDSGLTDISLRKVAASQTAFEDAPVTIQADVSASGFAGQEIVARLKEIGAVRTGTNASVSPAATASNTVTQLSARAAEAQANLSFRFQVQPNGQGVHFYELEARAKSELDNSNAPSREATLLNNRQFIVVDRGQDPFRILYLAGRPNWEFTFLNRSIAEESQMRLSSIIRVAKRQPKFQFNDGNLMNPLFTGQNADEQTERYDQAVLRVVDAKDEAELRAGFPKTEEALYEYSAVVIGDMEAEFLTHEQQALLQRFVSERGGGFLMLGGAESFRQGGYAGTPIATMLPVYLDKPAEATPHAPLRLTLTREGWLQPWTRLRQTESEERARLDAAPEFQVLNAVNGIKPGASVLSTVSDVSEKTYPALAVQRYGLGRTGALLVGDMWRWGLRSEALQSDMAKSWRQMFRWLVTDVPQRVSVEAAPTGNPAEVRLIVKARDAAFKPLDSASVKLTVRLVKSISTETNHAANNGAIEIPAEPAPGSPGVYETTYIAREAGAFSAEAVVSGPDGKIAGRASTGWAADLAGAELRSLSANRALMDNIARRTGGEIIPLENLEQFVRSLPERRAPITETWSRPLWHQPFVFLAVLACFVAEWGIRRWKGLP